MFRVRSLSLETSLGSTGAAVAARAVSSLLRSIGLRNTLKPGPGEWHRRNTQAGAVGAPWAYLGLSFRSASSTEM